MITILDLDEIKRNPYISSSFTPPQYPHKHDFFEISFCVTGQSVNVINGTPIPFQNGMCVILRPTDIHAVTGYDRKNYEHIDLYATEKHFTDLCNCFHQDLLHKLLTQKEAISFSLSNDSFSFLFNQCLLLKEMISNNSDCFEVLYNSIISTILSEWIKHTTYMQTPKPDWLKDLLPKFNNINFLQKNITQIAQETGYSLPYFSTQFKKYMGVSAIEYLTKKRVNFSKDLLAKNPNLRILEISGMLGFENPSTFSKHFLQEFKISPKEYQKQFRNVMTY